MPPAIIAALIGAGVTGVTTGLEASGTFQPSTTAATNAQEDQLKQQQDAARKQQEQTLQAAFKRFAPDAQAQTGGSLSDASFASLVSELSGAPANTELAQQTLFPDTTNSGGGSGLASGGIG